MGMDHSSSDIELSDTGDEADPEPASFDEAIVFLRSRIPMKKKEFEKLDSRLRFRAFTVARLAQYDAIEAIKQQLIKAQSSGVSVAEFWAQTGRDEFLKKAGFHKSNPWYWEVVFRTNVQTNYNAGRLMQFRQSPPKYLKFIGIDDGRQTQICRSRSGIVLPAGHPFWSSNWPPLHFGCRSTVRGVDAVEAKLLGIRPTSPKELDEVVPVQEGFGEDPLDKGTFYRLTPEMKERARQYGIEEEIISLAKRLSVKY